MRTEDITFLILTNLNSIQLAARSIRQEGLPTAESHQACPYHY